MTITFLLVVGALLLVGGAELLVRGASRLAGAAGISPLVIGLTVVAFGTSAPELAVSLGATLAGEPDIAVGNVVGSNIFNVLFILGAAALVAPLVVQRQLIRIDLPVMLGASVLLLLLARDGTIGRGEGGLLVGLLACYLAMLVRLGRDAGAADRPAAAMIGGGGGGGQHADVGRAAAAPPRRTATRLAAAGIAVVGLLLLVGGSNLFVRGPVELATLLGVSQVVIGLTIIAAGTSLPEVATSLLASLRGERDIAVGNVVGSNVFNILGILGACGLIGAEGVAVAASIRAFDLPIMVAVALLALPILFTGFRVNRPEGLLLLGYYAAYTLYLILRAVKHDALHIFGDAMVGVVLPLTALALLITIAHSVRTRAAPG